MMRQRVFPIALSVVLSILMMACKDSPTTPNNNGTDASALKGTWLLETINGQNFVDDGTIWMLGNGTASVTDAKIGCKQAYTYTVSGNKVIATMTANNCSNDPVGTRDTATWSVSNNRLTMVSNDPSGTITSVFRKVSGNDRVIGSWRVTKINGEALAQNAFMTLYLYGNTFEIYKKRVSDTQPCMTTFVYQNTGTALNVEVTGEECGDLQVGATGTFNWTASGDKITLTLVGGDLVLEAERF